MKDLEKNLQEISQDVKIIVEKVHSIEIDTALNTQSLKEHMRRTKVSEDRIEKVEDRMFKEKIVYGAITGLLMAALELIRRIL